MNKSSSEDKNSTGIPVDGGAWVGAMMHPIFDGIPNAEVAGFLPFFNTISLKPNEFLFQEGFDVSTDLYLIIHGALEVRKQSGQAGDIGQFTIARLTSGDLLGELSFIGGGPRSASIRATAKSVLISLSGENLRKLEVGNPSAGSQIMRNLLLHIGKRLKQTSENEVEALKLELANSVRNSRANLFFSYIIGLLCVYNLAIHWITNLSMDSKRASLISASIIGVFSAVLVLMIRQSQLPIQFFGLTTRNWKSSLRESMMWSTIIVAVLVIIKWILILSVKKYENLPLIDFDPVHQKYLALNFFLYGLHSPIQEFIARGVLQGSLQHFFTGKNITVKSIIISNALFSATHVHLMSGLFGVIVFIPGLFWGWLYSRHQSLVGVSVSHIMIGWSALFFLRIETLF